MTDYCILSDIYPLMSAVGELRDSPVAPDTTPATPLTATAAGALITQVSAEIDAHLLDKGYMVPVDSANTTALGILRAICQSGAAARILRSLFPVAEGVSGEAGSAASHEKTYQSGLDLIDGKGLAADMVRSGSNSIAYDFDDYSDAAATTRKPTSEAPF